MSIKLIVVALCALALPLATAADAAKKPKTYATTVGYQKGPPFYHGKLQSKKATCLKGRTVTLYGKRPGKKDTAESSGKSDKQGTWQVPLPIQDTSDDTAIYFKVSTAKHKSYTCKSGRTKDIKIGGN